MRGDSHLLMSFFISLPTFFVLYNMSPSVEYRNNIILIMMGILVGSLLPDLDASDAKVMHGWWRPIGFLGKHLFYRPMAKLLHWSSDTFSDEHRGFLHSFVGCFLISLFFAVISIVLYPLVWFVWYFWIGVPIGFLLHLTEDSFTSSGVRWFFPKGEPIRSTTRTHGAGEYSLNIVSGLAFCILALIVDYLLPSSTTTLFFTIGVTLVLLVLLHRFNPRISSFGDRMYPIRRLVEFYVEDRRGKKVDSSEPCSSTLEVTASEDPSQKHYLTKITGVGGQYGLERKRQDLHIEARSFQEGEIIEMQTSEDNHKVRIYFEVKDGTFIPFMKQTV